MSTTIQVETASQAHTLDQLQNASQEIRRNAERVIRDATMALEYLDAGYSLNAHGVLQSNARDLDTNCALRNAFATAARYAGCSAEHIELASKGNDHFFTAGI